MDLLYVRKMEVSIVSKDSFSNKQNQKQDLKHKASAKFFMIRQ